MLKSRLFTVQHDWSASIECTEAALQVFEEEYSLGDVAICLMSIGSQRVAGELDGLAESLRAVALFEELRSFSQQMIACYLAGGAFGNCLLWPEALNMYAKIVEINAKTKVGNYPALAYSYAFSSQISECLGEVEKALAYSLKALEISNKTDTLVNQGQAFSNLTVQYARLGDMKSAEEYFGKLMKLPSEIRSHFFVPVPIAKAALAAAKEQWKEASQCFTEFFEPLEKSQGNYFFKSRAKLLYAWALEKQGRFEDAKLQIEEVQKMRQGAEERFEHANLQAHLMVCNHVVASEEFEMRLDLVNVSRKPGFLVKAEDLIPAEFEVTTSPSQSIVLKGSVGMKNRVVNPFQVETLKLKIKASKPGTFTLNPQVSYIDELGETNTYKTNPITITVQPAKPKYELLPGRVSTGSEELDGLLLGGIPEKHALVLTSPSIDERELLIKRFVEAGAKADEIVFDIAQENGTAKALVEEYPSNFYLFICNPQAEEMFQASLNVFKLKGVENLTDIDIALTKAFRMLKPAETGPKRICIEIISDALLQHHAVNTRRWLSALLTTLKLKGFTILAVVDPSMHPAEELQAILGVFDGEIRVTEKETPEGTKRTLKIRKLINQKYSDKEIILNKEALSD
jgi:tetratricopeptide (TPR) repeat protein/KaiC/GvpD/RAD55 family RecA-like ATPase